jgi:hypothetical protein
MSFTEALSEQLTIVGAFAPRIVTTAAQTLYTDVVDMRYHRRAMVIAAGNAYGGTAMVKGLTVTLIDCDASGTAASTAFLTSSVTRVSGTAGEYSIVVAECKAEDLGQYGAALNAQGRYFKAGITTSTNVKNAYSVIVLADNSRYGGKAASNDLSAVKEIVQE